MLGFSSGGIKTAILADESGAMGGKYSTGGRYSTGGGGGGVVVVGAGRVSGLDGAG